ncbi:MAG: M23 family metallopeptidase [Candidatus Krumholzibacteriia bacterium]
MKLFDSLPTALLSMVLACSCGAAPAADPGDGAPPLWPLDLGTRYLTSNFMEYRPGRYHAGIDLKTESRTGYVVRAVRDGSIVRLRCTPTAYGRALYLQADDGATYVYAHLERFNDVLQKMVRDAQAASGRYRAEFSFQPGEVRVKAGDALALSGQSGTSGPHLHFEVRDAAQRPLNPLEHGFAVEDGHPPVIRTLRAIPVSPTARIMGDQGSWFLAGPQGGLAGTLDTLRLSGPVAFTAGMVDQADVRAHRLEPWSMEVELDGRPVYQCVNTAYAFTDNSISRLEWYEANGVRERWLFRRPGVTLPGRAGGPWHLGSAGEGLQPGLHLLEVSASDHAGNSAQVVVPLLVEEPGETGAEPAAGSWRREVGGSGAGQEDACLPNPFFDSCGAPGGWDVLEFTPGRGDPVSEPCYVLGRAWNPDAAALAAAARQGLELAGPGVEYLTAFWPATAAIGVPAGQGWREEFGDSRAGMYRLGDGRWSPAGELYRRMPGDSLAVFSFSRSGTYAVGFDGTGPFIGAGGDGAGGLEVRPGPPGTAPGITPPRWEVFAVALEDPGSGIRVESLTAILDGRPLVVEPDLPRDRFLVELPDDTAPGPHRLEVRVEDQAGNAGSRIILFTCME